MWGHEEYASRKITLFVGRPLLLCREVFAREEKPGTYIPFSLNGSPIVVLTAPVFASRRPQVAVRPTP